MPKTIREIPQAAPDARNADDGDFDSAVADVMTALEANGVAGSERQAVAAILESLRPAVLGRAAP